MRFNVSRPIDNLVNMTLGPSFTRTHARGIVAALLLGRQPRARTQDPPLNWTSGRLERQI